MKNNIKDWLIDWFEKNCEISKETIITYLNENYFNKGWIDSFKFILFLNDIETEFEISFSNEEFQGKEFSTINGLIKLISQKINE